jgi:hypothetical protein
LPCIAAIEQQGTSVSALGAQTLDQGMQMCKTSDLAESQCRFIEIKVSERVSLASAGGDTGMLQQGFTDEVWRPPISVAQSKIDIGFTEIDGQ